MKQQPIFSTRAEGALFSSLLGHPFPAYSQQMPENGSLRVAAYIRVSTDSRRQEDSYQRQEEHFTRLFAQHPEWEPVGIYSDYGLSATSQQKRVGFRRLLRHCREGKVQRILCKSISRFARNTRDFMEALSALREGGATIYFETEHLDTAYYTNEFLLTTLAALAQEESRSLSENIRWGIQKQYQTGEAKNLPIYGYRYAEKRDSSGRLAQVEIVEAQAKVVRWVFEQAALGSSFQSIAASLNQADIAPPDTIWSRKHKRLREGTPPKLGERRDEVEIGWTGEQISRMLQTERYAGDLLLQKKYKVNFYTETLKVNRGELPKYLVESHHPAIVSRELFGQVQQRFQHSRNSGVRRRYPFSQRLVCASCGRYYTIRSHGRTSVWYCPTAALSYGVNACSGETLPEAMLSRMFFQGVLLLDYLCSRRLENGTMPKDPVLVKTIVTTDMGEQIADHYGVKTVNVLTGFKFIGEQIGLLEQQGKADSYLFGFEESYGYLSGSYVRDKDAVDGAFLICEMFCYYASQGISLLEKLEELYQTYGYRLNTLHSYEFDGAAGFEKMQDIMKAFRKGVSSFGGKSIVKTLDYLPGLDGLPKSDVLKFLLEDNGSVVVRPSGTEPKLKTYISVSAKSKEAAQKQEEKILADLQQYFQ